MPGEGQIASEGRGQFLPQPHPAGNSHFLCLCQESNGILRGTQEGENGSIRLRGNAVMAVEMVIGVGQFAAGTGEGRWGCAMLCEPDLQTFQTDLQPNFSAGPGATCACSGTSGGTGGRKTGQEREVA